MMKLEKTPAPVFIPLSIAERQKLSSALLQNAREKGGLLLDPKTTSFAGVGDVEEDECVDTVVNAIRSVPTHYAKKM